MRSRVIASLGLLSLLLNACRAGVENDGKFTGFLAEQLGGVNYRGFAYKLTVPELGVYPKAEGSYYVSYRGSDYSSFEGFATNAQSRK